MQLPINIDPVKGLSLQQQLVEQIRALIARGVLLPGLRIPSSRELADQLQISRRTVVLSYERLIDDGLVETKPALGTFICGQLPSDCIRVDPVEVGAQPFHVRSDDTRPEFPPNMKQPQSGTERLPFDFRVGKPDNLLFPRNLWRKLTSEYVDTFSWAVSDYIDPTGHSLMKQAICQHLRMTRGITSRPEQIVVTAGIQEGLNLAARVMNVHGRKAVIEDPCYQGAAYAFLSLGAELEPVSVVEDGLDTDHLPDAGACIAYVTPSHQFPLGTTMSIERRRALIAWARATGTLIVEDDYDSDFRHNSSPLVALQSLAPESVVYLGTFSKSIGPGVRLGYAVFPEHLIDAARAMKSIMNNGHPLLIQAVMAQFISSGMFEQHLGRMRTCYLQRRNTLIEALHGEFPRTSVAGYEGGMHLVWNLGPEGPDAFELRNEAKRAGVGIYCLSESPTYQSKRYDGHDRLLLLGYSGLTTDDIRTGVKRIKLAMDRAVGRSKDDLARREIAGSDV